MKITQIRAVKLNLPQTEPQSKPRRPSWNQSAQPDLSWCGGLSEAVKIYTIGEAAGLETIPHGGANSPFGQHFALALPESPMAEYWLGSAPGIPLEEVRPIPGLAVPHDGYVVPSDAPGFGMEMQPAWIAPWAYAHT